MKFFQLNITSFNTFCDNLWYHQMENHFDRIFLEEISHNNSTTLGKFKNWKVSIHSIFKKKTSGYGVGAFLPNTTRCDMVWTGLS